MQNLSQKMEKLETFVSNKMDKFEQCYDDLNDKIKTNQVFN